MARRYVVKSRDTLRKIAKDSYGDSSLSGKLAEYNGITNPDLIRVNQGIELPSRRELEGKSRSKDLTVVEPLPAGLVTPNGLGEIIATFGNLAEFIRNDGSLDSRWESEQLGRARLPFPIPFSWDPSKSVRNLYGHKKLVGLFSQVFTAIEEEGLRDRIRTFGGCFNFRSKRTSTKLSTHSWGIAIDLNPDSNPQGRPGDMDPGVVQVFRRFGFKWGGDWTGGSKDPMHFQFCTGY